MSVIERIDHAMDRGATGWCDRRGTLQKDRLPSCGTAW
jgi:hypothetical protein